MTRAPVTKDDNSGPGSVPNQPDGSSHLLSPRLGRAEPPALNSLFSLPGRTTRALDTRSATVAPGSVRHRGQVLHRHPARGLLLTLRGASTLLRMKPSTARGAIQVLANEPESEGQCGEIGAPEGPPVCFAKRNPRRGGSGPGMPVVVTGNFLHEHHDPAPQGGIINSHERSDQP
jgi:hypothetical protein